MSRKNDVSVIIEPAHTFLWAVKTYLDLVSGNNSLTAGSGLKRLYAMTSGVMTFNDNDIDAIVDKAIRTKLLPTDLRGFMNQCIAKNMALYGQELHRLIAERIRDISTGEVHNAPSYVSFNSDEARRSFYTPPVTLLTRLKSSLDAIPSDINNFVGETRPLENVRGDAELILEQLQGQEGYNSPVETSWVAIIYVTELLVHILESNATYKGYEAVYKTSSHDALKILWIISKLLLGDLTTNPQRRSVNKIDLDKTYKITDGTLAAIPFPLQNTFEMFWDKEAQDVSMRGRMYLSAVSSATFYRCRAGD